MLGFNSTKPVPEHKATGEIERVYYEIKQTLRVTGVNLNFRTWAGYDGFLPLAWEAVSSNAATYAFETLADGLRAEAARHAEQFGPLEVRAIAQLGESQAYHVQHALDLYHYVNPKLLLLTSAVALALEAATPEGDPTAAKDLLPRGAPAAMHALEMEDDEPDDRHLEQLFSDIQETLSLPSINSDYRTLALWPDYLDAAWRRLKPVVQTDAYAEAANQLRETARQSVAKLPYPTTLSKQAIEDAGTDVEEITEVTQSFMQLLPGLIINIALLEQDYRQGDALAASPYPIFES